MKQFPLTEGITAEEAEMIRKARISIFDDIAKTRKSSQKTKSQTSNLKDNLNRPTPGINEKNKVDEDADSSAIIKESNNEQITDEEDMKSWLEEQNRLVEKRLTERLRDESSTPHED